MTQQQLYKRLQSKHPYDKRISVVYDKKKNKTLVMLDDKSHWFDGNDYNEILEQLHGGK